MAVCFALGILLGRISRSPWYAAAGIAAGLAGCLLLKSRLRFTAILAVTLAAGCLAGFFAFRPALPEAAEYEVTGVVADEIGTGANGQVKTVLSHVTLNGRPFSAGAYWSFYPPEMPEGLAPGRAVSFHASLYHPDGASNPDGYDFREELLRRGITVGLYGDGDLVISDPGFFSWPGFTASLRHRLSGMLTERMGEEAGGYASAMLLGMRKLVSSEDRTAFARLGIAHVLSVSGFHVGVLIGLLALIFRLLRLPQRLRLILYALLLGFYCSLCGSGQPVIRASLLALLLLEGKLLRRPRVSLHLLSAVFLVMLLVSPAQLTGLSFQMSFSAMLGLILITPYLTRLISPAGRIRRRVWEAFCAAIGAQIGILLPELYYFQQLPLLGLLVNVPALLFSSGLILLYWFSLLCLPVPFLSGPVCSAASLATGGLTAAIRWLGGIPGITLWTRAANLLTAAGVLLLFAGLCRLFRLRARVRIPLAALGIAVIAVSLCSFPHTSTEYIQFSVGSADAAVLWDRDTVIVFDTGYHDGVLASFLRRRRLTPDAVILSHLHADHVDGLADLRENGIPVRLCYLPEGGDRAELHPDVLALTDSLRAEGTAFIFLAAGDEIPVPSGTLRVLWPERGRVRPNQDANESSLVVRMELMGTTLLQAGDLDGKYEMYAAAPSDILKMAHHGSKGSTSEEFLASVSPQAVLLSCDRGARSSDAEDRVSPVPLYSTAAGGALTVRFAPSSFSVETYLPVSEE